MLLILNKSGIATKKKLSVGACVIDSSYQGIIHYHVFNFSNEYQQVKCDEKIVQMVQLPIQTEMNVDKFTGFDNKTLRNSNGFGSTGLM